MPTNGADQRFLLACVGSFGVGVVLLGIGYWLMPARTVRHWWRNR